MKGLILKDWRLMFRQMKMILLFIFIFVGIFSFLTEGVNFLPGFYTGICLLMTINCFSYDEMSGFDKLVASSPVPKHKVVLARYITAFITGLAGMAAILLIQTLSMVIKGDTERIMNAFLILLGSLGVSLLIVLIVFPLFYKFGVNKSRILFTLLFMIPAFLVGAVASLMETPDGVLPVIPPFVWDLLPVFFIAILIIGFFLSYSISVTVYQKKEF